MVDNKFFTERRRGDDKYSLQKLVSAASPYSKQIATFSLSPFPGE